jgi:hypothetical protein
MQHYAGAMSNPALNFTRTDTRLIKQRIEYPKRGHARPKTGTAA